jgi:hypothetical protein
VEPTSPPVPLPTSPPNDNGCCTHNYKECINWCGDSYDSCMTCSTPDVGWIPNGAPSDNCGDRWTGCGENNDSNHNGCCDGLTCQFRNDGNYFACLPGDGSPTPPNPTNPPVPNPVPNPTSLPVSNPTNPPVPSPTTPPNNDGCCSLDFKDCVDWCGPSYDSCMNCGNNDVIWLPNGKITDTCGERWSGCGQDNDLGNDGCCNGLTCQWRGDGEDYFACLPGDGTPTPPQTSPTNPPQSSPVQPPSGGGGGGDLISGKAT